MSDDVTILTYGPSVRTMDELLEVVAAGQAIAITGGFVPESYRHPEVTFVPLVFVSVTTLSAGVLSVKDNFWPMAVGADPTRHFQGYLNTALTVIMMTCVVIILANAMWKWLQVLSGRVAPMPEPVDNGMGAT